ncbi:MAG: hypothetical protein WBL40_10000 [Terrimicrobiaceae bacterium]
MKTLEALILIALADSTLNLRADDIKLEQCPAAVQDTIRANARDGRIDDINLITIEDRTLYVVEVDLKGGKDLKLHVGSDGKQIKTREDAALSDAPDAVQDAVKKLVPAGGKVDDVDKEIAAADLGCSKAGGAGGWIPPSLSSRRLTAWTTE